MTKISTNQPILILGMHRSGTSCLAGCLQSGGLTLGDVNTSAQHNKKGNREHERIRDIHDRLMSHHGYTWDRPPPQQLDWRPLDLERLTQETATLKSMTNWGVKDPRTIFCVNGWNQLFSPVFVSTFRHPEAVADSLVRRSLAWRKPMEKSDAISLWINYNSELLEVTRTSALPFVRFDVAADEYLSQIQNLAKALDLNATRAIAFFTESLQHEHAPSDDVPAECRTVWEALNDRVNRP